MRRPMLALFTLLLTSIFTRAIDGVLPEPSGLENKASRKEAVDVTLKKRNTNVAMVSLADRKEGLQIVFSADSLDKGRYVLTLKENCDLKSKGKAQKLKSGEVELGDFTTVSGNISSEFLAKNLSVGESLNSVKNKAVSLIRVPKKGARSQVACAIIHKKDEKSEGS